jgi:hypothetical protein
VKAFLNPYNRMGEYMYHVAHHMFSVRCRYENMDQFTKFLGIVATMDWTNISFIAVMSLRN